MKQILLSLCLLILSMDCNSGERPDITTEADMAAAKVAVKKLAAALKTELKEAMQTGGPIAAIGVCNVQAMPITQKVAQEQGVALSRVSLKNRNPANLPNDWQTVVLEDFERRKSAGEDVENLAWSETLSIGGEQEFRFMKAIPTAAVCLNCHGVDISPQISRVLTDLYPEDRATGYREGDIRGAFVAIRKLAD